MNYQCPHCPRRYSGRGSKRKILAHLRNEHGIRRIEPDFETPGGGPVYIY